MKDYLLFSRVAPAIPPAPRLLLLLFVGLPLEILRLGPGISVPWAGLPPLSADCPVTVMVYPSPVLFFGLEGVRPSWCLLDCTWERLRTKSKCWYITLDVLIGGPSPVAPLVEPPTLMLAPSLSFVSATELRVAFKFFWGLLVATCDYVVASKRFFLMLLVHDGLDCGLMPPRRTLLFLWFHSVSPPALLWLLALVLFFSCVNCPAMSILLRRLPLPLLLDELGNLIWLPVLLALYD